MAELCAENVNVKWFICYCELQKKKKNFEDYHCNNRKILLQYQNHGPMEKILINDMYINLNQVYEQEKTVENPFKKLHPNYRTLFSAKQNIFVKSSDKCND